MRKIIWLVAAIVLVVSISINVLAFAGFLNPQSLQREKDQIVTEFTQRMQDLEKRNQALESAQRFLETKLESFMQTYASAKTELSKILDDYRRLKAKGQP